MKKLKTGTGAPRGCGDVAQLVERGLCKPEAWGSIPHISTILGSGLFLDATIFLHGPVGPCMRSLTVE